MDLIYSTDPLGSNDKELLLPIFLKMPISEIHHNTCSIWHYFVYSE
uniref:Uncharacterized protein n=1 Tax=Arundo donax TaxID=35708 RepID=A0A0A8ZHA8_ARUDO